MALKTFAFNYPRMQLGFRSVFLKTFIKMMLGFLSCGVDSLPLLQRAQQVRYMEVDIIPRIVFYETQWFLKE